ncbi:MAG: hypothetical protein JXA68_07645 [Ignavibacteriales bacterium]|nr:hypothetical protein [Ignavibacteriales bacterium]
MKKLKRLTMYFFLFLLFNGVVAIAQETVPIEITVISTNNRDEAVIKIKTLGCDAGAYNYSVSIYRNGELEGVAFKKDTITENYSGEEITYTVSNLELNKVTEIKVYLFYNHPKMYRNCFDESEYIYFLAREYGVFYSYADEMTYFEELKYEAKQKGFENENVQELILELEIFDPELAERMINYNHLKEKNRLRLINKRNLEGILVERVSIWLNKDEMEERCIYKIDINGNPIYPAIKIILSENEENVEICEINNSQKTVKTIQLKENIYNVSLENQELLKNTILPIKEVQIFLQHRGKK